MSIKEKFRKIKIPGQSQFEDLFIVFLIILVALSAFGLGRLSALEEKRTPVKLIQGDISTALFFQTEETEQIGLTDNSAEEGVVVVSKNGKKYHFPWCSGAQRMKEENKKWFSTIEAARESGYTPAANCKGLK